jgi:hypothetical protein
LDEELTVDPTPRGNADGYQNKALAGKAIHKNMKTKEEQKALVLRKKSGPGTGEQ